MRSGSQMMSQSKMRIVHIASGDAWGGAERVLSLLVEGTLTRSDVEVEVIVFNSGKLADTLRELGAQVHIILERGLSFMRLASAVERYLSKQTVDVIHAHRYKEIVIAAALSAKCRCQLVVTVHGLEPFRQLELCQALKCWAALFIARVVGARIVAVSKELQSRLGRVLGRQHVCVIPNPLPTVRGEVKADLRAILGWDSARPVVGFIGRLEAVKGPDRFLDLAAMSDAQLGFVIIGTGRLQAELAARISSEGLGSRIALLGEMADPTPFLRQMDVLVLTSRHEGLPMVVLEAAVCEVPVVAFDVGGLREILDSSPAARLVPPGDVERLRAVIADMLHNRLYTRRAAPGWSRTVRAQFSLQSVLARYFAVYRESSDATTSSLWR